MPIRDRPSEFGIVFESRFWFASTDNLTGVETINAQQPNRLVQPVLANQRRPIDRQPSNPRARNRTVRGVVKPAVGSLVSW